MIQTLKKIFFSKENFESVEFDMFIEILESYMKSNHPKIKIDYSVSKDFKNETNLKVKKSLMIENVVKQFLNFEYTKTTQKSIPKDKFWQGYNLNSVTSFKYPTDWLKRKEFVYRRDDRCCNRCGKVLNELTDVHTAFVKEIKDGGTFHFENIIILCFDCYKIVDFNQNDSKGNLHISLNDKLLDLVKN